MNSYQLKTIIQKFVSLLDHEISVPGIKNLAVEQREYDKEDIPDFIRDLTESSRKINLIFLESKIKKDGFHDLKKGLSFPILVFARIPGHDVVPLIIKAGKEQNVEIIHPLEGKLMNDQDYIPSAEELITDKDGKIIFLSAFSYKSLVSDSDEDEGKILSPIKRLSVLLSNEKKDIYYIYVYAVVVGIISLSLPLGIQAIIGLISGGMMFSSVALLISLVIIGILVTGGLQIMQISLVEVLQRRVFTKTAFEFAFRIPRMKMESLLQYHGPELMNRFFDILTIQKGLPKLLIDLSAAVLQILFGLILLAFYHPFFVFFGFGLITVLVIIFYLTGPKGLESSIKESKQKYKVAFWLEELARTMTSFKLAGTTNMPIQKTDENVNNYLTYRKKHFKVLISQFGYILVFKTFVTGGLLIIGTLLVLDRQITLGQFVASEIVIILILNAVEKIILSMDVVYDLLTSVDKIGHVTDIPLEKHGKITVPHKFFESGIYVKIKNLKYKYPTESNYVLKGLNLEIAPGEKVCLAGYNASGKSTFLNILAGVFSGYEGAVTFNNISFRDLDLSSLRDHIAKNVSQDEIFDGTILDNLAVGKPYANIQDIINALEEVGLADLINSLPKGLETELVSGGRPLPSTVISKLTIARCLAKKPKLMIVNDVFSHFQRSEKLNMLNLLVDEKKPWTLVTTSNDPMVMAACDRTIIFKDGQVLSEGKFEDLVKAGLMSEIIYN